MRLNELEVKIQLKSSEHFKQIFEDCRRLYGEPTSHLFQRDEYYDTDDAQLKKHDLVVRIRSIGDNHTIALKSPRLLTSNGLSHRIELEFLAAEGKQVYEQLNRQGLNISYAGEKERWTFVYGDIEIVLDKLPFLGSFIEVEGPDEAAIQQVIKKLKLSIDLAIRKNYGELMEEKFQELGLNASEIQATFSAEERYRAMLAKA